jgi:hypothetical protein
LPAGVGETDWTNPQQLFDFVICLYYLSAHAFQVVRFEHYAIVSDPGEITRARVTDRVVAEFVSGGSGLLPQL